MGELLELPLPKQRPSEAYEEAYEQALHFLKTPGFVEAFAKVVRLSDLQPFPAPHTKIWLIERG